MGIDLGIGFKLKRVAVHEFSGNFVFLVTLSWYSYKVMLFRTKL